MNCANCFQSDPYHSSGVTTFFKIRLNITSLQVISKCHKPSAVFVFLILLPSNVRFLSLKSNEEKSCLLVNAFVKLYASHSCQNKDTF